MSFFELTGDDLAGNWSRERDYVYAGARRIASETNGTILHYHLDHVGSTRLVTDEYGAVVSNHDFLPFGEEIGPGANERDRFTGHERDDNDAGTSDDLDYMVARYYSPHLGRFLQVDEERGSPQDPQSLNRYAYALGNPVKYIDPDGRQSQCSGEWLSDGEALVCQPKPPDPMDDVMSIFCARCDQADFDDYGHNGEQDYADNNFWVGLVVPKHWPGDWAWVDSRFGDKTTTQENLSRMACLQTWSGHENSFNDNGERIEWGFYAYRTDSGDIRYSEFIAGHPGGVKFHIPFDIDLLFIVHVHNDGEPFPSEFDDDYASDATLAITYQVPVFTVTSSWIGVVSVGGMGGLYGSVMGTWNWLQGSRFSLSSDQSCQAMGAWGAP